MALVRASVNPGQKEKHICVNLQPLKRNFDRIETERIYRVIENAFYKVSELRALHDLIIDDAKIFAIPHQQLRDQILKHQRLVQHKNIRAMKTSLKDILKYCTRNGIMLSTFAGKDLDPRPSPFSKYISKLCKILHEKLLTETEEENARSKFLLQIMEKARHSQSIINSLTDILKEKVKEKQHQLNEKDRIIRQMKRDLDGMASTADEDNNMTLNDAAKQILTDQKALENKQTKLGQELIDLKDRLYKLRNAHYVTESTLRKRKIKMAGELHNWILKYDQDMGWRQKQIEEIQRLNEQDLEDIQELEKRFDSIEKEYNVVMEEKKLKREESMKEEKEERRRNRAVTKIQAVWRGYNTRLELSGKKNKKKGKGKGKKGKKKK